MCHKILKSWLQDACRKLLAWRKFISDIYVIVKLNIGILAVSCKQKCEEQCLELIYVPVGLSLSLLLFFFSFLIGRFFVSAQRLYHSRGSLTWWQEITRRISDFIRKQTSTHWARDMEVWTLLSNMTWIDVVNKTQQSSESSCCFLIGQ